MTAISVDLASGDYSDVGVVTLTRGASGILITPLRLPDVGLTGRPDAQRLAYFLMEFAKEIGATAIGLDGPQGWKDADNGEAHARVCEARLRTQGKTGIPGITKPGSYLAFIQFCIETFDALDALGWPRFGSPSAGASAVAVETFPTAAWRSLGLPALPGKSKARDEHISEWTRKLTALEGVGITAPLGHDELQAAVSGLGVLALAEVDGSRYEAVGRAPFHDGRHWLEGWIVNPRRSA